MYNNGIDMRVCVNGRPVREYLHENMILIESRNGTSYSIKLKNDNGFRVMAIVSVDGIDVISGKPAEGATRGYIIDSYSSTEIRGYRVSDSESASFVFSAKGESYAANVPNGSAGNCGVIGVRVFREKEVPKVKAPEQIYYNSLPFPGGFTGSVAPMAAGGPTQYSGSVKRRSAARGLDAGFLCCSKGLSNETPDLQSFSGNVTAASFDTGTTWGDQQTDRVKKVEFEVGAQLTEMWLYYTSSNGLVKMGVDLNETTKISRDLPKAFGNGYCVPPTGWTGRRNA